ncbi:hypothetical protein Ancab_007377 [Ancistrocladus abbreviatus]
MGIDTDDLKILVHRTLQFLMKSCHQCAKNHPLVFSIVLLFVILYIFFPSLFSILFYSSPFVICAAFYLGGRLGFGNIQNLKKDDSRTSAVSSVEAHKSDQRPRKDDNEEGFEKQKVVSEATLRNDLVHRSLICEMPMKIREEKSVDFDSTKSVSTSFDAVATREVEREASIPGTSQLNGMDQNSKPSQKFISDISESDAECQEDDDDDEPQEETNKAVQWTEDDQRNLIDLGSSEIERNRRLESLIAKRRARKLLTMQPRRNLMDFGDNYVQVASIIAARPVDNPDGQPGSAPSVLLPARSPFDLPYDPHEEKPVLTGGSFVEEFFNSQPKDISFCRHESFIRGPSFIGDLGEDPVARSLPGFLMKPKTSDGPGISRFRRLSDMEEHAKLLYKELHKEDQLNGPQVHSYDQTKIMPLEENLVKQELPQEDKPALVTDIAESKAVQLLNKEGKLLRTNEEDDAKTKGNVKGSVIDMKITEITADEAELKLGFIGEKVDDPSSPSSSEVSEDTHIVHADKNEAFRNSVKKVLTCLIPKNKGFGKEKIGPPIENLFDSSPTARHPTKMEERSFYTGRPFHTPNLSISSDMLVEVSEASSPTFNAEVNTPTDRESLAYDADVDKDVNSGDEDLWGASPHPVIFEEFEPRFRVHETGEMGKSPLGLSILSSTPIESSGQPEKIVDQTMEDASSPSSPSSIVLKDSRPEILDFYHKINDQDPQVSTDAQSSRSSVSSSSEHLPDRVQGKQEQVIHNLVVLPAGDVGSRTKQEQESSRVDSQQMIRQEATTPFGRSSILVDNSQVGQHGTQGGHSEAGESSDHSVSPVSHSELVLEQASIDLSLSPRSVLQESVIMDEVDPASNEQIMLIEDHFLFRNPDSQSSVLVDNSQGQQDGNDVDSEARQSSHNSVSPVMQLEVVVEQVPIDLCLSPKSVLEDNVTLDEVASTSSEHNMLIDVHQSDGVMVRNNPQYDRQENHSILDEGRHLEYLIKQSSPGGIVEAAKTAATADNVSMRESPIHEDDSKPDESIQDGVINGSSSSSSQQTADTLPIPVEEASHKLDIESEAKV